MLFRIRDNAGSQAVFAFQGVPRLHLNFVIAGDKPHHSQTMRSVVGQQLVDTVAVVAADSLMESLCSTLVAAADHEQV